MQDKWLAVKDQALQKWSRLTAEELASLLRQRYKYGRIQADMEIRNWLRDCAKA